MSYQRQRESLAVALTAPDGALREGMRGPDVAQVQAYLHSSAEAPVADGWYGPRTKAAVRRFQREHGLAPDGVVGRKTSRALRRSYRKEAEMSEIAKRAWREPAVAIGLLTSIAIAVITLLTNDPWTTATIAGVAAPLVSALGIRPLVTPD